MVPLDFIVSKFAYRSGILISFTDSKAYQILLWVVLLIEGVFVFTEVAYFVANLDNVQKAAACMGTLSITLTSFIRVLVILARNKQLKIFVDEIREIYKERPSAHDVCLRAEKVSDLLSKCFVASAYVTLTIMTSSPLINMLIEYKRTGAVVETRWGIPFSMLFPFDYKTPVNHAIVMITLMLITIPYISPFLAIDVMFLGSANYVVAYFKDLRVEILSLQDLKLKKKGQPMDREFLTRMTSLIDHHNRLFSLVQKMEDVFGDILVTQYAGAMFCFCSLGYLSILVSLFPLSAISLCQSSLLFRMQGAASSWGTFSAC